MTTVVAESLRNETLAAYRRHVNRSTAMIAEVNGAGVEARAAGQYVYDLEGRRYLDCGGYGVLLLGHGHPRVRAAVVAELERQPMGTRLLLNAAVAKAAETIADVAPDGLEYVALLNSGADAVELAFKLARLGGKQRMIAMRGGFHGKTLGALTLTANDDFRGPFEPLVPGVQHVAFGDIGELRAALADAPGRCCVVLEPVQAEAGVIIPPAGYLRAVADLCRASGHWLVLDEIQTGLGRVGSWWAATRDGVTPDILLAGKILSGGVVPCSAVIASSEVWEPLSRDPFLHSATFANMPLAAAAAAATIDVIESESVVDRANALGRVLSERLGPLLRSYNPALVADFRADGLLLGIEIVESHLAAELIFELLERGVIVNHSLSNSETLRLTPPVCLDESDVSWLCSAFEESLEEVSSRYPAEGIDT